MMQCRCTFCGGGGERAVLRGSKTGDPPPLTVIEMLLFFILYKLRYEYTWVGSSL